MTNRVKEANDSLCIPKDARILKYDLQCVQKNQKVPMFALKMAKVWVIQKMSPPWKKFAISMWLVRELMIPYAYVVMLEYLNITYSVYKKSESTNFCTKMAKMWIIQKMSPPEKKFALSILLIKELMIPHAYVVMLEYLNIHIYIYIYKKKVSISELKRAKIWIIQKMSPLM